MKIVEYNSCKDVVVEFQDKYKYHKNASYGNFKIGKISNPYYKTIFNRVVGGNPTGDRYQITVRLNYDVPLKLKSLIANFSG